MTLQDYDFLISKMEEISSLDREIKTLERNISKINIQNAKHEAKIATLSEDLSILKSNQKPEKHIPQKDESVLQKLSIKVVELNSRIDDCKNQLKELKQELLVIKGTFPEFISTSDSEEYLWYLTVAELKDRLKVHDLPISGKKKDLVARVSEVDSYDYKIEASIFGGPSFYYFLFGMAFYFILLFLTDYFPSIIPNLADACSAQELEHHKSGAYCDTWHDATNLLFISLIVGGLFLAWVIANRISVHSLISGEIKALVRKKEDLQNLIDSLSADLKRHKKSIKDSNADFTTNRDRAVNDYSKKQKKYQSDLARIKSHEESTIQLLGMIDSNTNEVKEKLAKIHDSRKLIISSLESVAHLTPRNSKL